MSNELSSVVHELLDGGSGDEGVNRAPFMGRQRGLGLAIDSIGRHAAWPGSIKAAGGTVAQAFLAAVVLLSSDTAHALGLGQIQVLSALGEPLEAEISLIVGNAAQPGDLKATIPGYRDHMKMGFPEPILTEGLKSEIVVDSSGRTFVRLTSRRPVREPMLNFLVQVRSRDEDVRREYALLLDPPLFSPRRTGSTVVSTVAAVGSEEDGGRKPSPALPRAERAGSGDYGPVRPGETLYAIARSQYPRQVDRVLRVARVIFEQNRGAFIGNDQGLLMQGAMLALPTEEAMVSALSALVMPAGETGQDSSMAAPSAASSQYGPVRSGQTLFGIARELSGKSGTSIDTMMRYIFEQNPDAFIGQSMDLLREGAVLMVPATSDVPAVAGTAEEVTETPMPVAAATQAFTSSESAPGVGESSEQISGDNANAAGVASADGPEPAIGQTPIELRGQLDAAELQIEREAEANRELRDALAEAERQVDDLQTELEKRDAEIGSIAVSAQAIVDAEAVDSESGAATVAEPAGPGAQSSPETQGGGTSAAESDAAPVELRPAADGASAPALQPAASGRAGGSQPDASRSWVETAAGAAFSSHWTTYAIALALIFALAGVWWRRKTRGVAEKLVDHRDQSRETKDARSRLRELRVAHGDDGEPAAKGATRADVIELGSARASHLAEEAGVLLAYGDFEGARGKINDAIQIEPHRDEHKIVLLDIYEASGQQKEARELSEELLSRADGLPADVRSRVEDIHRQSA